METDPLPGQVLKYNVGNNEVPADERPTFMKRDEALSRLLAAADVNPKDILNRNMADHLATKLENRIIGIEVAEGMLKQPGQSLHKLNEDLGICMNRIFDAQAEIELDCLGVQAVCALSYDELTASSLDAKWLVDLLAFFSRLGFDHRLFLRATAPKKQWNTVGEKVAPNPNPFIDPIIDPSLYEFLLNEVRVVTALSSLMSYNFIRPDITPHMWIIHEDIQRHFHRRVIQDPKRTMEIQTQLVLLICQSFPCSEELEGVSAWALALLAGPHIKLIWGLVDELKSKLNITTPRIVIDTLLAAMEYGFLPATKKHMRVVHELMGGPPEFPTAFVAKNITMGVAACDHHDYGLADDILQAALAIFINNVVDHDMPWNPLNNALVGKIGVAMANVRFLSGRLSDIENILLEWRPKNFNSPSEAEKIVFYEREITLAQLRRYQRDFVAAEARLQANEANWPPVSLELAPIFPWQRAWWTQMMEIRCEFGNVAEVLAWAALSDPQLAQVERQLPSSPRIYDLRLSRAELNLRAGRYRDAWSDFNKILSDGWPQFVRDIGVRMAFYKALAGLARVGQMQGEDTSAEIQWEIVLHWLDRFDWGEPFARAIVFYSQAQILHRLGQPQTAQKRRAEADLAMLGARQRHLFVGLGTYWFDFVSGPLGQYGPFPIVGLENLVVPPEPAVGEAPSPPAPRARQPLDASHLPEAPQPPQPPETQSRLSSGSGCGSGQVEVTEEDVSDEDEDDVSDEGEENDEADQEPLLKDARAETSSDEDSSSEDEGSSRPESGSSAAGSTRNRVSRLFESFKQGEFRR